jgi:hypothetical protein
MHFIPHFPNTQLTLHLINLVCAKFTIQFHYNPLLFHPFIRYLQLTLEDLDTAHTGILVHAHDTLTLMKEKLVSNISTVIRVCPITAHKRLVLQPFNPPIFKVSGSLIVHTGGTCSGDTRPSPTTRNLDYLYCYSWNFLPEEVVRLSDIIRHY